MKCSPGELIDQKYRIVRLLGSGGMGSVYEAENIRVERKVALKVMHQVRDRQDIARFEREARAAQIGSPHIVQVFDLGYLADGAPYLVMEYLSGETLGERLVRKHRLNPAELLPIARPILDALAAAHRAGIIHRDLKPDNIFIEQRPDGTGETVKLLDFGISKFTDAARKAEDVSLTRSGVAVGTPHFMSPEQVQGKREIDTRTDLYSLGVILYRCLSGRLPFQSEDVAPLLVQILMEEAPPLQSVAPGVDAGLGAIVARAMARRAEDRFQTAVEFRSALDEWDAVPRGAPTLISKPTPAIVAEPKPVPHVVTSPPWSSTQSIADDPARTLRQVIFGIVFVAAGIGGLFVAYRLWSPGRVQAPTPPAVDSRGPTVLNIAASTGSPAPVIAVASQPSIELLPTAAAAVASTPRTGVVRIQAPTPAAPTSVPLPAPPPAPARPPAAAAEDPDNRHMSRGVN